MKFKTYLCILACASIATLTHATAFNFSAGATSAAGSELALRDEYPPPRYSCNTHPFCNTVNIRKYCDIAVNFMIYRSDLHFYRPYIKNGINDDWQIQFAYCQPCFGNSNRIGCSVYIEGPDWCQRSGNQVWWDYQDIKRSGCSHCGWKTFGKYGECSTRVSYDDSCLNCNGYCMRLFVASCRVNRCQNAVNHGWPGPPLAGTHSLD